MLRKNSKGFRIFHKKYQESQVIQEKSNFNKRAKSLEEKNITITKKDSVRENETAMDFGEK